MGLFPTEVTRNSGNVEILSRNFNMMLGCKFNEYLHTARDANLKSEF